MQSNSELQLRYIKREVNLGRVGVARQQGVCLGTYSLTENIIFLFNFYTVVCTLMHTYTVHCICGPVNCRTQRGTRLWPDALFPQTKHNNFTSDSIQGWIRLSVRMWYCSATFSSLHGPKLRILLCPARPEKHFARARNLSSVPDLSPIFLFQPE